MFTGIITAVGRIVAIHRLGSSSDHGLLLTIQTPAGYLDDVALGDSIALNGACMTVTQLDTALQQFQVEISTESLSKTTGLDQESPINLEKALRANDRLGGHLVSGHVDGIGTVTAFTSVGESWQLQVLAPQELGRFLAYKGSISINGVSLTVNEVQDLPTGTQVSINLIAHTLEHTTLGQLQVGSRVNLEIDLIARYCLRGTDWSALHDGPMTCRGDRPVALATKRTKSPTSDIPPPKAATVGHRQSVRLQGFNYAAQGAYFITLCAIQQQCLFGKIEDDCMMLNDIGNIVQQEWLQSANIRAEIELRDFVVMPNHFHGIVVIADRDAGDQPVAATNNPAIRGPQPRSLAAFVAGFKSASTKRINQVRGTPGSPVWQRNYYEHIIGNEADYLRIAQYVADNPRKWAEDSLNPQRAQGRPAGRPYANSNL